MRKGNGVAAVGLRVGVLGLACASLLALPATTAPVARAQGDDIATLSDEFSDAGGLSRWQQHHVVEGWPSQLAALDVNNTAPGQLYLEPYTSVWYAGFRAPFLFKNVTGDFVVSALVRAAGKTKEFPEVEGSLVGLMVRELRVGGTDTWKKDDESYVSFTHGLASGPGGTGPSLEITVTTRGSSPLEWRRSRPGWVELRMARIGQTFVLLHRFDGSAWAVTQLGERSTLLGRFGGMRPGLVEHAGLGPALQVGITAMTDWETIRGKYDGLNSSAPFKAFNAMVVKPPDGMPDLRAYVDYVRFRRLTLPAQFQNRRPSDLSEQQLLGFLGD